MHDKRCLAHAVICAVENLRDAEDDLGFRVGMQDNLPLTWADEYLAAGTVSCLCGYRLAHNYAEALRENAKAADDRGDAWYAENLRERAAHAEATRTVGT